MSWFSANKKHITAYSSLCLIILILATLLTQRNRDNERLFESLVGQTQKYEQLSEHAAKLEITYKTQEALKAELELAWKAEKEALQGRVKILSNATFLIKERARESASHDLSFHQQGKTSFVANEIRFEDGPPIGYVLIDSNGKVTSKIYNHAIDVSTAVTKDEGSGRYQIASKADFILKSVSFGKNTWLNQRYPLKITGGKASIDPTEPSIVSKSLHWWAPTLNGGLQQGYESKVFVGVSSSGFGYSARDLDWKFLQVALTHSSNSQVGFSVTPALYRPFPNTLKNSYVGVGVDFDKSRQYSPFLSLSVGF